jgi:hypothetical protein
MICHQCGEDKLSDEFPHEHLTVECIEHPLLHCLRDRNYLVLYVDVYILIFS